METDIISGLEAGLRTMLVLTGSTLEHQVQRCPYRSTKIVECVADLIELVDTFNPTTYR
ncbi:MAG: HAD hydrolase-like protein [Nocardioidaceae bacterium]